MELEDAFMVEHESHAAAVAQRTAALVEIHADVGHRAVGIVGRSLHEEGDAVRAVAFVDHLLVIGGILLGGTLDGTLDVLLGPPALTAISISLPILVNTRAMCPQRFSLRALRYSNALPI